MLLKWDNDLFLSQRQSCAIESISTILTIRKYTERVASEKMNIYNNIFTPISEKFTLSTVCCNNLLLTNKSKCRKNKLHTILEVL